MLKNIKVMLEKQSSSIEKMNGQLIELKLQEIKNGDKEEEVIEFFEKNLTDVWKEIGNIKQKVSDQDQSEFTYPGSLNNELGKNRDELDNSDIKKESEEKKNCKNILGSINPPAQLNKLKPPMNNLERPLESDKGI